jgi:hypothetical protein
MLPAAYVHTELLASTLLKDIQYARVVFASSLRLRQSQFFRWDSGLVLIQRSSA